MTSSERQRICIIFRGPNFDLDHFGRRLEALSSRLEGICIMGFTEDTVRTYGNFTVHTTRWASGIGFTLRHLWRVLRIARAERSRAHRVSVCVSADPLKGGLFALLASRVIGAAFAPEVNGDFAHPANYMDGESGLKARVKRRVMMAVGRFVLKRADGARILYPQQLDFMRPHMDGKAVHHVFEYVDLAPFRNLGEEKVVLFAGFPFFLKGVDLLIEAFKRVAPNHPDWKLKILGWFPDTRVMNALIGGHAQISHHAAVSHGEMPQHMGRSGIFVLPSRTEAMGRVLLEAMAAEKPRIGSNVGGIPTVIEDGKDGLLFESGDVDALAERLERLMSDAALRRELGSAAHRRMLAEFTLERYLDRICAFYADAAARRPPSSS